MKNILFLLLLSCALAKAAPPAPVPLWLSWQDTNAIPVLPQYVPGSNDCYIVVATNSLTPLTPAQWPVIAVFTNWTLGTNGGQIYYSNTIPFIPGTWFVAIITSNFWGQVAVPSNVAQTGPASTPTLNLNLSR